MLKKVPYSYTVYQYFQCPSSKSLNQLSSECLWGIRQKTELLTGKYLKHF